MTKRWGPVFWRVIHIAALGYPEQPTNMDKLQYKAFFDALGNVLPCAKCRRNYGRHYSEEMPIDASLGSRDELFAWTVAFHNVVNVETGKKEWTVERARRHYDGMLAGKEGMDANGGNAGGSASIHDTMLMIQTMLSVVLAIVVITALIYFHKK